ncbi:MULTISPECIES: acyl-CoA dehydrogenase family protein [Bacillaceae]|uniref:Acyl-CoA/acyl-ACP dehydrogenase n=1 Tax=Evansella alkalicola TaxID=745819 RepID=A0ABS6JSR1_9BACI|nr:acyl-CoA dehydrogenase family protein [Litchfieldia alkalitelluris]MBU9721594.1 acyl-CoA/acyl-ACP dehydrogenase [Bacillus alkalicola]
MKITDLHTPEERLQFLQEKVEVFKERADKHDKEGSFPVDNINDLRSIGYPALTVPKRHGGMEISLLEMVQLQEVIGKADGSTALSIGWHMGIVMHLDEQKIWNEDIYQFFCEEVVKKGSLLNNAASEPATGSPTRGGKPETTAKESDDGTAWIITGRKNFTTMSPVLDYFVVSASIDGTDQVGNFLIPRGTKGMEIEETWDSIAMRGTGSHDLVLTEVMVKKEHLVENVTPGNKSAQGWLLHIPACYLGIAGAAQNYAIQFAKSYSPNSISGTISDLPNVRQKIGEMELRLQESKHFLYSTAREWDEASEEKRSEMKPILSAVKHSVVNNAIEVVDLAMRVVGARSLSAGNPLQRYYRDVRAGLHNPPMDDMTIMLLAADAIEREREK